VGHIVQENNALATRNPKSELKFTGGNFAATAATRKQDRKPKPKPRSRCGVNGGVRGLRATAN